MKKNRIDRMHDWLRERGWPFVAVDETKKAIFADAKIKSFHFLAYSSTGTNLLVYLCPPGHNPDTETIEAMTEWEKVFGYGFEAVFAWEEGGRYTGCTLDEFKTTTIGRRQHDREFMDLLERPSEAMPEPLPVLNARKAMEVGEITDVGELIEQTPPEPSGLPLFDLALDVKP